MSLVSSLRSGVRSSLRSGLNPSDSADPMSGVTRDATSGIYCPSTAGEWATTLAAAGIAAGNPTSVWLMQDSATTLLDAVGAFPLPLGNTVTFQNAVTGWARKGVGTADGGANCGFTSTDAGLPDPATVSHLLLGYVSITGAPGGTRGAMLIGATNQHEGRGLATSRIRYQAVGNAADGTVDPTGQVRPFVMRINITASTNMFATDQEKQAPTFTAPTGRRIAFGGFNAAAIPGRYLYGALFTSTAAERSDANVKTLLQTLGWTIGW